MLVSVEKAKRLPFLHPKARPMKVKAYGRKQGQMMFGGGMEDVFSRAGFNPASAGPKEAETKLLRNTKMLAQRAEVKGPSASPDLMRRLSGGDVDRTFTRLGRATAGRNKAVEYSGRINALTGRVTSLQRGAPANVNLQGFRAPSKSRERIEEMARSAKNPKARARARGWLAAKPTSTGRVNAKGLPPEFSFHTHPQIAGRHKPSPSGADMTAFQQYVNQARQKSVVLSRRSAEPGEARGAKRTHAIWVSRRPQESEMKGKGWKRAKREGLIGEYEHPEVTAVKHTVRDLGHIVRTTKGPGGKGALAPTGYTRGELKRQYRAGRSQAKMMGLGGLKGKPSRLLREGKPSGVAGFEVRQTVHKRQFSKNGISPRGWHGGSQSMREYSPRAWEKYADLKARQELDKLGIPRTTISPTHPRPAYRQPITAVQRAEREAKARQGTLDVMRAMQGKKPKLIEAKATKAKKSRKLFRFGSRFKKCSEEFYKDLESRKRMIHHANLMNEAQMKHGAGSKEHKAAEAEYKRHGHAHYTGEGKKSPWAQDKDIVGRTTRSSTSQSSSTPPKPPPRSSSAPPKPGGFEEAMRERIRRTQEEGRRAAQDWVHHGTTPPGPSAKEYEERMRARGQEYARQSEERGRRYAQESEARGARYRAGSHGPRSGPDPMDWIHAQTRAHAAPEAKKARRFFRFGAKVAKQDSGSLNRLKETPLYLHGGGNILQESFTEFEKRQKKTFAQNVRSQYQESYKQEQAKLEGARGHHRYKRVDDSNVYVYNRRLFPKSGETYGRQVANDLRAHPHEAYVRIKHPRGSLGAYTAPSEKEKAAYMEAYPNWGHGPRSRLKTKFIASHETGHVLDLAGTKTQRKNVERSIQHALYHHPEGKGWLKETFYHKPGRNIKFGERYSETVGHHEGIADKYAHQRTKIPPSKASGYPMMAAMESKHFGRGYEEGGGRPVKMGLFEDMDYKSRTRQQWKKRVQEEKQRGKHGHVHKARSRKPPTSKKIPTEQEIQNILRYAHRGLDPVEHRILRDAGRLPQGRAPQPGGVVADLGAPFRAMGSRANAKASRTVGHFTNAAQEVGRAAQAVQAGVPRVVQAAEHEIPAARRSITRGGKIGLAGAGLLGTGALGLGGYKAHRRRARDKTLERYLDSIASPQERVKKRETSASEYREHRNRMAGGALATGGAFGSQLGTGFLLGVPGGPGSTTTNLDILRGHLKDKSLPKA